MTNKDIAELLRSIVASYQIMGENHFKIVAYERAIEAVTHLTEEIENLYTDGKLANIDGIGPTINKHLVELCQTGHVKHFETVLAEIPPGVFPLLKVPGIGPKKAYALVTKLGLSEPKTVVDDLKKEALAGAIAPIDGFGEKSQADILINIETYYRGEIKENRILIHEADDIAKAVLTHLALDKNITQMDILGSLRRRCPTIGDIDIAVVTKNVDETVKHFYTYPHHKIIESGVTGASILLTSGRQVDLRVQEKESYGAMLQYFTGSKSHNIKLRTYALSKGYSLSEYGIKLMDKKEPTTPLEKKFWNKEKQLCEFEKEKDFYEFLGIPWIPPEMREDKGEVDAAKKHTLPALIEHTDIRGDFHMHSAYDLDSSHDLGAHHIHDMLDKASALGYEYIGVADHNPAVTNHTEKQIIAIMKKRKAWYDKEVMIWQKKTGKKVALFVLLEVDILADGTSALPKAACEFVDGLIMSIHSSFIQPREDMTSRIISALTFDPKVRIFGHPTGRLINKREGVVADWSKIYTVCAERNIALEINASPYRLDLPDVMVYEARGKGIRFTIDSDAHAVDEMEDIPYGIGVGRRGWATKDDIINALPYNKVKAWMENKLITNY